MPIILDIETRQTRGRELIRDITGNIRDHSIWLRKREICRNLYLDNGRRLDVHWAGASNIHLPVIFEKVEAMVPKLVNAFFGIDPIVSVSRPAGEYNPDETKEHEWFANWALRYDIPDFFVTVTSWFRNTLLDGVGVVKTRWKREWRDTCEIYALKRDTRKGEPLGASGLIADADTPKTNLDFFDELFGVKNIMTLEETGAGFTLDIVEDRRLVRDIRVEFHDSEFVDEIEAHVFRPVLCADNPVVEVVEGEDLIVPYRAANIQTAPMIAHQYWLTKEEIIARGQSDNSRDRWDITEDDAARIESGTGYPQEEIQENRTSKRSKDEAIGEFPNTLVHRKGNKYLILEVYKTEWENGKRREVIYQIPYLLKKIVHAAYLDEACPHGRRPFATIHYQSASDRFYVPGMAERLADINIQVNTTINQVNDNQELINNPIFFYVPGGMNVDPDTLKNIPPGTGIPVHDPGAVTIPQWTQTPLANMSMLESVMMFADRITGLSPMSSGSSQMRNAPRTARGTLALISEGNVKTDIIVKMAQEEGWTELMVQLFGLYERYLSGEKWFWVIGADKTRHPASIMPKMLRGRFEYIWQGNTTNSNPEVQRTLAQLRYNTAVANPLYQYDMVAMRELLRDFLMHFSEGTNPDTILPNLPGQGTASHMPMSQKDENVSMNHGIIIEPLMTDNHQQHIADLDAAVAGAAFEQLPQHVVSLYATHKQRHMQMMADAAAQQRVAQLNSRGGAEQSVPQGDAMATMEGGVM